MPRNNRGQSPGHCAVPSRTVRTKPQCIKDLRQKNGLLGSFRHLPTRDEIRPSSVRWVRLSRSRSRTEPSKAAILAGMGSFRSSRRRVSDSSGSVHRTVIRQNDRLGFVSSVRGAPRRPELPSRGDTIPPIGATPAAPLTVTSFVTLPRPARRVYCHPGGNGFVRALFCPTRALRRAIDPRWSALIRCHLGSIARVHPTAELPRMPAEETLHL
jgi:hypothetical protein